ncbi:hypothetical protein DFH28DRAFT_933315 [Melampsora americana]|nr:hypothetical protein DFH28DRAFT_933315 [Melampsora americana]
MSQLATNPPGTRSKGKSSQSAVTSSQPTRKQMSWVKDLNLDGKSCLELIVEWLALTWGNQDSPSDVIWMCMESTNSISTNYLAFCSANLSKKECTEQCAKYLNAKGFAGPDWKGCKQKIEHLESKFRSAEAWRNSTGAGIMEKAEDSIDELQAENDLEFDPEEEEAIKASAAKNTKDMLDRLCPYYDSLVPIMGQRAGNQPLSTAETFARSNKQSHQDITPTFDEIQSSGWDETQDLGGGGPTLLDQQVEDDKALPHPNNLISKNLPPIRPVPSSQNRSYESSARSSPANLGSSSSRTNPPALFNQSPSNTPRRGSGTVGFQIPNSNTKQTVEEEDTSPEAVANRIAKKAKQDKLDLLKLDCDLAQERKTLAENEMSGVGMSRIALI